MKIGETIFALTWIGTTCPIPHSYGPYHIVRPYLFPPKYLQCESCDTILWGSYLIFEEKELTDL